MQRIGPDFLPREPGPQPTWLIVNRDRHDNVKFMQVNAVTARLMQWLEDNQQATGRELLQRIAAELQHPQPEAVVRMGADTLKELRARDIVIGCRRAG